MPSSRDVIEFKRRRQKKNPKKRDMYIPSCGGGSTPSTSGTHKFSQHIIKRGKEKKKKMHIQILFPPPILVFSFSWKGGRERMNSRWDFTWWYISYLWLFFFLSSLTERLWRSLTTLEKEGKQKSQRAITGQTAKDRKVKRQQQRHITLKKIK